MATDDALGDRMKTYEGLAGARLMPHLPALARIDGRAFRSFAAGLARPYDPRLTALMVETTEFLVREYDARVGYCQSDEISLLFVQHTPAAELPFLGKTQKLVSNLAASAAAYFNSRLAARIPEKAGRLPTFDCRAFSVPSREEAANYFLWRCRDAEKNSVQTAARHHFSHRDLQDRHGGELQEMLFSRAGVNWNDYPAEFKRGSFVRRVLLTAPFTTEELAELPPLHNARRFPGLVVERWRVGRVDVPPFGRVTNRVGFLLDGEAPEGAADDHQP